jgi:hypothetical protein
VPLAVAPRARHRQAAPASARAAEHRLALGANEWDFLKASEKLGYVAHHAFLALAAGPALPLVHLSVVLGAGTQWRARDSLLWLATGWVLAGIWQASRLMTKIRDSRRRMGDPMYLAKLVEHQIAEASRRSPA